MGRKPDRPLRLICTLAGDPRRQADMRVKYGAFLEALAARFEVVEVFDASLRGIPRYLNALQTFHPDLRRWKERFFKNVPAFQARSRRAARHLQNMRKRADFVLQIGGTFDAGGGGLPLVLYTDNTTRISARQPHRYRFPFSPEELARWLALEGALYRRARHIFVRARVVQRSLVEEYGLPEERVSVVGGGVNFSPLPTPSPRPPGARPTVLFIGQDFRRKGGDVLLQAFAALRREVPEAQLLLVSAGPLPSGAPTEGVRLIAPTWDREAVAALYRQADVFVLPSRQETWGDVLLEAMAFGLPCVGVFGQAMEEIIRHEETGLLVPPEDSDALAKALARLLSQPALRQRMGEAARQRVAREFTWARVVERIAADLPGVVEHELAHYR